MQRPLLQTSYIGIVFAMAEATVKGGIIDNVSQLSDAQKDPSALREQKLVDLEDPDANLSQEEREAIVCETIST